jgi:hypothetical protein
MTIFIATLRLLIAGARLAPPASPAPIGIEPAMIPGAGKSAASSFVYYSTDQG